MIEGLISASLTFSSNPDVPKPAAVARAAGMRFAGSLEAAGLPAEDAKLSHLQGEDLRPAKADEPNLVRRLQ